jgi:acyl carrier protein
VEIWCQLLGRKTVSIHENFFHLGGHSLLATQTIWRIAGAFNVDLPVRAVFEAPTIAELAELVSRAQPSSTASIARRGSGSQNHKLSERLGRLSDSELGELLHRFKTSETTS